MKKIITTFFITLSCIFLFCFPCKASEIAISAEASSAISESASELILMLGRSFGWSPISNDSDDIISSISALKDINLTNVFSFQQNVFNNVHKLSAEEIEKLTNAGWSTDLYDPVNDISVSLSDLYVCEYDNGYFTGTVYITENGDIVEKTNSGSMATICCGGSVIANNLWSTYMQDLADDFSANGMLYCSEALDNVQLSFYAHFGKLWAQGSPRYVQRVETVIYVPNMYAISNVYPIGLTSNGIPSEIYFNNSDNFIINNYSYPLAGYYALDFRFNNSNTHNGIVYNNSTGYLYNDNWSTLNSYSDFMNYGTEIEGNNPERRIWCFGYNGFVYDRSIVNRLSSLDITPYYPIHYDESVNWDRTKDTLLDDVLNYINATTVDPTINEDYDENEETDLINYPIIRRVEDSITIPSANDISISNSGSIVLPDDPSIEGDPVIEGGINVPFPSLSELNIPFISGLKNRFPFSIPFDIYNLLKSLEAERITPYIDTTIVIPVVNYPWHLQYDLSAFDDTASLFRTLFFISFVIGLAFFSFDHFFGS